MCYASGGPRTTKARAARSEAAGRRCKNVARKAGRVQMRHSLLLILLPIVTGKAVWVPWLHPSYCCSRAGWVELS